MIGPVFVQCIVVDYLPSQQFVIFFFCLEIATMARVEPGPSDNAQDISSGILVDL